MFKNALISVSNKDGLVDFIKPLVAKGLRVVSTGGTAKHLREHGIAVTEVAEQTGFPEMMDGRVRTLHPYIHMPLLARSRVPEDMRLLNEHKLQPFDLIIVNLYPFEAATYKDLPDDELIEYIDIGGPSLLRAAAKNHERIAVVCDPSDYQWIAQKQELTLSDRRKLAARVFVHTSQYDALIAKTLDSEKTAMAPLAGSLIQELRYGENPAQKAWWFKTGGARSGLHEAEILHGKALSYNNILDIDAAAATVRNFQSPCAIGVKHNNPCGAGVAREISQALRLALKADPVSIFGGIVATNRMIDLACAEELAKLFLECVVAPDFSGDALARLQMKKDLRLLRWPDLGGHNPKAQESFEFRTVAGGYLVQTHDTMEAWSSEWRVIGEAPSSQVREDLMMAWKICAHLKSNAIALVENGQSVGLGMGQVNRVEAVEQALARLKKYQPQAQSPVLASDAFFPFPDSIELIAGAGVRWVIQPGGSIRDDDVIQKARDLKVNMILTGARHFRH